MKIQDVINLINVYGKDCTLEDVLKDIQRDKKYKCPKCDGDGVTVEYYNAYPKGFPDSDFVYKQGTRNHVCELCNGEGYTNKLYKPKMIQDGWE